MKMDTYTAIGIFDGFVEPKTTRDIVRAAVFIAKHGPRGVLAGNGTSHALEIAAYAKAHGYDAAEAMIRGEN